MDTSYSFKPIIFTDSKILILGSFPSIKSMENKFYYTHPQNQFWRILSEITRYPINNQDQKIWLLKECKLGLWDMVHSCNRENSLDSSLENEVVNDISALLEKYPNISKIAFTGRKAEALYKTNFSYLEVDICYLPSPSSAYAKLTLEQKSEIYKKELL